MNHLITHNLFTTITNVNFDKETIIAQIEKTLHQKKELLSKVKNQEFLQKQLSGLEDPPRFPDKAVSVGVLSTENEDIRSLRELITYGLKGLSAYTEHANALLQEDEETDVSYNALWQLH